MKIAFAIVSVVAVVLLAAYAALLTIEVRASNKVLAIIASAQPGQPVSNVIRRYGVPSFQTDDVLLMHSGGAPVTPYCEGKTLHQYYVTPPCTWVNIYTDKDGFIAYVNWSRS